MTPVPELLDPRSVALIGVSPDFERYNGRPLRYLSKHKYPGKVFAVNPKYREVGGIPCFESISAIGEPVDLAVVMVSASKVMDVLEECAAAKVPAAVVMSSGLAEVDGQGRVAQDRMRSLALRTGMRIVGPNSAGFLSPSTGVVVTMLTCAELTPLAKGGLGLISQSGTACSVPYAIARSNGLGFTYVVSTGNEADLGATEFAEFLVDDLETELILLYVEEIRQGRRFISAAQKSLERGKPIVCLKVGRSNTGRQVVASHTGALAGVDAVYEAVFHRYGVVRVQDLDEMIDVAVAFSLSPAASGDRLFVLTVGSGGGAAIAADLCEEAGLRLPPPSPALSGRILESVSPLVHVANPLDAAGMTGTPTDEPLMMRACLESVATSEEYDAIIVVVPILPYAEAVAGQIVDVAASRHLPILSAWLGGDLVRTGRELARAGGVPAYDSISDCVRAARGLAVHALRRRLPPTSRLFRHSGRREDALKLVAGRQGPLSETGSRKLLSLFDIPSPNEVLARTVEDAVDAAQTIGYPVALKAASEGLTHKTEVGGVRLDLRNDAMVAEAFEQVLMSVQSRRPGIQLEGILIQQMVRHGLEIIIGVVRDPQFGPLVMSGSGGVLAEVAGDVIFRLAPVDQQEAEEMLAASRVGESLRGTQGRPAHDLAAAGRALSLLSHMAMELEDFVAEVDINPLMVLPRGEGALAIDALVVLERATALNL